MRRTTASLSALAALALVVSACGDDEDSVATSPDVDGMTYVASESAGSVEGHDLVPGSVIRISFADGSVAANAGCNNMSGAYTLDGAVLQIEAMAATQMACEQPLMDQDTWLAELLQSSPTLTQEGDELTIAGESSSLTLVDREVAEPDVALEETTWVVESIIQNEAVSSVPEGVSASIRIVDGQAEVATGCNTGGGEVEVDAEAGVLTFGPIATTKMACEPDATSVEQAVLATLVGEVGYTIEADVLTLTGADAGLQLRAES